VVVDLGGGTFDVTVMEYDGAELTVRATGGDPYLGGANFDKALFDYLAERFEAAHGLDINDPAALLHDPPRRDADRRPRDQA
jgi:molecular chaperone DnaK